MSELIRACPILALTAEERQQFVYTGIGQTSQLLNEFGYGPTKKLVDSFYQSPDHSIGVGVLWVREKHCVDHFGVLRGVDLVEAIAQSFLLLHHQIGTFNTKVESFNIGRPLFTEIKEAKFLILTTPGAILNIVVQNMTFPENKFNGYGWVLRGTTIITAAEIGGAFTSSEAIAVLKTRADSLQKRSKPLFQ